MTESSHDLASIFVHALVLAPATRDEFLRSCEPNLRYQVVELLKLHGQASGFLSRPALRDGRSDTACPKAAGPSSVLLSLNRQSDVTVTPVVLPEPGSDRKSAEIIQSHEFTESASKQRYQIQGEIARGGMGAILKGRDIDLGRNLAVKVLLENHRNDPDIIRRFIEEAQIGGQLQHPGIVPVYELGTMDDRPFFTMKLIKGKTLSALLRECKSPDEDRGRFLGIFEQICQTLAYAHSRRVIHRDLKPSNIMVGDYGEVQVMDWGLAKVLPTGGVVDEKKALESQKGKSIIQTLRSAGSSLPGAEGSGGSETQAGSVMGTLAYMPPEQALGEVDLLDERGDVFGLGAILCEILTGKPPYVGKDATEIHRLAARGKTEAAIKRLDACRADAGLVAIAKDCLELEPKDRPRDAGVLSGQLTAYLESVETRLRETEVQRVSDAIRVQEERKRFRLLIALAASVVLVVGLTGTGVWWLTKQEMQRQAQAVDQVNEALSEVRLQQGKAKGLELARQVPFLEQAVVNANRAVEVALQDGIDADLRREADELLAAVTREATTTKREAEAVAKANRLRSELERIRLNHAEDEPQLDVTETDNQLDTEQTHTAYLAAFDKAGLDLRAMSVEKTAVAIGESRVRESIIAAIDHWSRIVPAAEQAPLPQKLTAIADAADNNDLRKRARQATAANDFSELNQLLNGNGFSDESPHILAWLGEALRESKAEKLSAHVLSEVQGLHPGDFWINYQLARSLLATGEPVKALGFARAALSAHPDSPGVRRVVVAAERGADGTQQQLGPSRKNSGNDEGTSRRISH